MRTDPTRFDTLLANLDPQHPEQCFCHVHWTPPQRAPGRARFSTPEWDADRAVQTLGITWFDHWPGEPPASDTDGLSSPEGIWIKPTALMPVKTVAHELGHQLCGHNKFLNKTFGFGLMDVLTAMVEIEAESVALLVVDALGLEDEAESARHYIAMWRATIDGTPTPKGREARIKQAAQRILSAGFVQAMGVAA